MVQRVTYRRRLSYNTQSNKVRKVRTPGSKVVVQYVQKRAHGPRAPHDSCDCGKRINGIAQLRPYAYKKISKRQKTVSRPYGGVLCAGCVKSRIVRAFLLEEIKTIKQAKRASKKWFLLYLKIKYLLCFLTKSSSPINYICKKNSYCHTSFPR